MRIESDSVWSMHMDRIRRNRIVKFSDGDARCSALLDNHLPMQLFRPCIPHIGIPSRRFTLAISTIKITCISDASSEKLGHKNLHTRSAMNLGTNWRGLRVRLQELQVLQDQQRSQPKALLFQNLVEVRSQDFWIELCRFLPQPPTSRGLGEVAVAVEFLDCRSSIVNGQCSAGGSFVHRAEVSDAVCLGGDGRSELGLDVEGWSGVCSYRR
jgi:hypothetical protein